MMKKNGFISISIIYSFFIVFMLLLLLIMSTYINNRFNFSIYKNDIKKKVTEAYNPYQNSDYLNTYVRNLISSTSSQTAWKVLNENSQGVRFQGKTPKNYVKFNNELWRIIGVFDSSTHGKSGDLVKIIRSEPLTQNFEYNNSQNNWSASTLRNYLNGDYYNSKLDGTSKNLIEQVYWKNGSSSSFDTSYVSNQYSYERNTTGSLAYVGLMYPSDYGYAALQSGCPRSEYMLSEYSLCRSYNWLVLSSQSEWSMTPSSSSWYSYTILPEGRISSTYVTELHAVRPVVYLKSQVKLSGGSGDYSDPYTIAI